ncbi:hypothetical protein AVEN_274587-1, partial [Araneus ventricosus]
MGEPAGHRRLLLHNNLEDTLDYKMDDNITFKTIKGLSFGILSTEDIKKISVLEITNVEILDCLGHAATNGLYDLRL